MEGKEYAVPENTAVTGFAESNEWIAVPMLVVDGPATEWQDVMVRPASPASPASPGEHRSERGFCVEVLVISALDAEEREEWATACGLYPDRMSVLVEEPFDNALALERTAACMRAAGVPVKELREVGHDEFFDP